MKFVKLKIWGHSERGEEFNSYYFMSVDKLAPDFNWDKLPGPPFYLSPEVHDVGWQSERTSFYTFFTASKGEGFAWFKHVDILTENVIMDAIKEVEKFLVPLYNSPIKISASSVYYTNIESGGEEVKKVAEMYSKVIEACSGKTYKIETRQFFLTYMKTLTEKMFSPCATIGNEWAAVLTVWTPSSKLGVEWPTITIISRGREKPLREGEIGVLYCLVRGVPYVEWRG